MAEIGPGRFGAARWRLRPAAHDGDGHPTPGVARP